MGRRKTNALEEIKRKLYEPPVLHLPEKGAFHYYSNNSKFVTRSAPVQIQNSKPNLIEYASKIMPEAAKNYSFTELELDGLAVNIAGFAHLLKGVDFVAVVVHLA